LQIIIIFEAPEEVGAEIGPQGKMIFKNNFNGRLSCKL
jgi:hypothetical protein